MFKSVIFRLIISKLFENEILNMVDEHTHKKCADDCLKLNKLMKCVIDNIEDYIIYDMKVEGDHRLYNKVYPSLYHVIKNKFSVKKLYISSVIDEKPKVATATRIAILDIDKYESLIGRLKESDLKNRFCYVLYGDSLFKVPDSFNINNIFWDVKKCPASGGEDGHN